MKHTCILLLLILFGLRASAQDTIKQVGKKYSFSFNEHTVVKDSTGKQYPYKEWQALSRKGYVLWPENMENPNTAFILEKRGTPHIRYVDNKPGIAGAAPAADQQGPRTEITREQYMAAVMTKPRESESFTTGEAIEPFSTRDINGNKIKLKELRGKVVVLNFWFIGCPACMQEIPELNKLVDDYKNNPDVVFLAIALDYNYDLKKFLKVKPFNYDIIGDGRYIADYYKIKLYPTSVILDKEGKVAFHTVGFAPNSPYWLHKTIDERLK